MDWHAQRGIVALACAGRDMIKVWPLPVETPWWEDGLEESDELRGQHAVSVGGDIHKKYSYISQSSKLIGSGRVLPN